MHDATPELPSSELPPPSSAVLRQAAALALAIGAVYIWGACRTIYVGDSGELVTAAAILGIPHPSGYPLYVLLGKLWISLVPIGSVAFRMSLFSSFMASLTCGLLVVVARRQGWSAWAATFGALLLAFSPSFWSQANIQRVYSLSAFFVVALVACTLEWTRQRDIRWMVLAAFVAGLGACNHTVMGVLGLAVGVFAVLSHPALLRRVDHLLACVGAGLLGLLPYVYLPWRSRQDPVLDWGNPETLQGFLDVLLRRDFWHRAWAESTADYGVILADYGLSLGNELLWGGTALAVVGVVGFRRWPVLLPLLIMLANLWVVGIHGSRSDIFIWHRYYIPSYIMAVLLATYGWHRLEGWRRLKGWPRALRLALIVPLLLCLIGWPRFDRSDFTLADEFSRTLLEGLPPGARLAASDDNILFVLMYLQFVEKVRPDVDLILQGVGSADLPNLRFDPDTNPLFFTHHPNWSMPGLEVVPIGLVFRTARAEARDETSTASLARHGKLNPELRGAWDPDVPKDYLSRNLVGHYHYMQALTHERHNWPAARREFERAAAAAFDNDVLHYNLGLIYRRQGLLRRALAAFERAAEINPRHIPSANPTRPSDKVVELRQDVEQLARLEEQLLAAARASNAIDSQALISPGSAAYHRLLAQLLESAGAVGPANGHRFLALEQSAEITQPRTNLDP